MKTGKRAGGLAALVGFVLVLVGLFGSMGSCAVPGVPCPKPSWNEIVFYVGIVVLVLGVVALVWSGWRGSAMAWLLAAAAVVPATWTLYELGRQSLCPLVTDPDVSLACLTAFGEMTAPVLSVGLATLLLVIGAFRLRQLRVTSRT